MKLERVGGVEPAAVLAGKRQAIAHFTRSAFERVLVSLLPFFSSPSSVLPFPFPLQLELEKFYDRPSWDDDRSVTEILPADAAGDRDRLGIVIEQKSDRGDSLHNVPYGFPGIPSIGAAGV